jgi:hypothetical protein
MEIEYKGDWAASATETEAGFVVILSKTQKDFIDLISFRITEISGRVALFLAKELSHPLSSPPIEPIALRRNLSSRWGDIMTEHLIDLHHQLQREEGDVVAYTAWRYESLTAWGESSAVREISLDLGISINTVRNRLQLARERGILSSPGSGARLGR